MKGCLQFFVIIIIIFFVLSYFGSGLSEDKCSTEDRFLMGNIAEDEVEKYAKYDVVSTENRFSSDPNSYVVVMKAKNALNATVTNTFDVTFSITGCESYVVTQVKKR
jgi:hypothetical protein